VLILGGLRYSQFEALDHGCGVSELTLEQGYLLSLSSFLGLYLGKRSHLDGELRLQRVFLLFHLLTLVGRVSNRRVQLRLDLLDMAALLLNFLVCLNDLLQKAVVFLLDRPNLPVQICRLLLLHMDFFFCRSYLFFKVLDLLIGLLADLLDSLVQLLFLRFNLVLQLSVSLLHSGFGQAIEIGDFQDFILLFFYMS
jgi:hypothetical protein